MTVTDGWMATTTTADTRPATPQTVTVGNGGPPNAAFTATPNPVQPNTSVTFNGAGSTAQGGGSIARYEWDLDGNGSYETDTGAAGTATLGAGFATNGVHTVNLRVTDNCGGTDTTPRQRLREQQPAHCLLHRHAQPGGDRRGRHVRRLRLDRSGRNDRQLRVGP